MIYGRDTVGGVIVRLRKMLGHVGKKDRATVLEAIGAIEELATRLHRAEHSDPSPKGSMTVMRAAEAETDGQIEETSPAETRV